MLVLLQKYDIGVRFEKREFLVKSVAYLAHALDQHGVHGRSNQSN